MVLPLATLEAFSPVAPVTPFTYRDNDTNMTILRKLQEAIDALVVQINLVSATDATNLGDGLNQVIVQFNAALNSVRDELVSLVEGSHDESVATDPTTGLRLQGLSRVVSNVYDNLRIFAYFAKQYDDQQLTCAQYEALNYSARHFDLAPLYPTLNDTMGA